MAIIAADYVDAQYSGLVGSNDTSGNTTVTGTATTVSGSPILSAISDAAFATFAVGAAITSGSAAVPAGSTITNLIQGTTDANFAQISVDCTANTSSNTMTVSTKLSSLVTVELGMSKRRLGGVVSFKLTSGTDGSNGVKQGTLCLYMYDELSSLWVPAPQDVVVTYKNTGVSAATGNTAAAALATGVKVSNNSGLTNIGGSGGATKSTVSLMGMIFYPALGKQLRLQYSDQNFSLTTRHTLAFDERGLTAI